MTAPVKQWKSKRCNKILVCQRQKFMFGSQSNLLKNKSSNPWEFFGFWNGTVKLKVTVYFILSRCITLTRRNWLIWKNSLVTDRRPYSKCSTVGEEIDAKCVLGGIMSAASGLHVTWSNSSCNQILRKIQGHCSSKEIRTLA